MIDVRMTIFMTFDCLYEINDGCLRKEGLAWNALKDLIKYQMSVDHRKTGGRYIPALMAASIGLHNN
jgi:hypothetical protein